MSGLHRIGILPIKPLHARYLQLLKVNGIYASKVRSALRRNCNFLAANRDCRRFSSRGDSFRRFCDRPIAISLNDNWS
jgi:hypothetical protein